MEIVVAAHKSVAELGVIARAEDMHRIMDAERDATLAYLDSVTRDQGGRRGRARRPVATSGLVYAHTRHATSRAGDPSPHDHVVSEPGNQPGQSRNCSVSRRMPKGCRLRDGHVIRVRGRSRVTNADIGRRLFHHDRRGQGARAQRLRQARDQQPVRARRPGH
jgi:hypothetical protein